MSNLVNDFNDYRQKMNEKLLKKEGSSKEVSIATLVGGTIVIPNLRRAYEFWEALKETEPEKVTLTSKTYY